MRPSVSISHTYLRFPRDPPCVPCYANLFRLGQPDVAAPLVAYVGGATSRDKYLARSAPAPEHPVMYECLRALAGCRSRPRALDLLVCPCPFETGRDGPDKFVDHFDHELVRALAAKPTAYGFVGYSAGAGYATHLAIVVEARALAVFGGAGVTQAMKPLRNMIEQREGDRLQVGVFRNSGDGTAEPSSIARVLTSCDVTPFPASAGDHEFASYAANGTVQAAFRFVLDRLGEGA